MELFKASEQWNSRPADQRYRTPKALHDAVSGMRATAIEKRVNLSECEIKADKDGKHVGIVGQSGNFARLTSWAFKQLCAKLRAPASYLSDVSPNLAIDNLRERIATQTDKEEISNMLIHQNSALYVRAVTSERYTRIWNADITRRILQFEDQGWRVPPARPANVSAPVREDNETTEAYLARLEALGLYIATDEDAALSNSGIPVKAGDICQPAGLYASSEDMFAFMVNPERVIDDATDKGLMRGFFVWNSEVGKSTFGIQKFYLRGVCGNHIVWGAEQVTEIRLRHVGNADERAFKGIQLELKKYADESASDMEAKIKHARTTTLHSTDKDQLLDFVFRQKSLSLTRDQATRAYDAVIPDIDGDPTTVYGYAQGLTRISQEAENADERVKIDRAAGKILDMF